MANRVRGVAAVSGGAVFLALLASAPAQAQQQAIELCRAMPSDAERIACLERALMDDSMGRPEADPADSGERGSGGGLRLPSISLPSMPFFGGDDDDDATPVQAEERAPAPVASTAPAAQDFGTEQVAVARGEFERPAENRMHATIASADANHRGIWTVQLDNGQRWRQTERESIPVRIDMSEPQPVEIWRSGFGGYRMELLALDRTIKVRRED